MMAHERAAAIFWLLVGGAVAIHAYRLGLGHLYEPGPGFIFFLAAGLLIVLSGFNIAQSFSKRAGSDDSEKKDLSVWSGIRWKKIVMVLAAISVYIYLFNLTGFGFSTFLLMLFLFKAVEPTRWWVAVCSSIATTVAAYALFKVWLGVPFPTGIFGL
jgi:Tripartite tricarboxylate transporter TctB family